MTPRAASLSREDRRQAILDTLVPLLVERGGEVSTKEVAAAAGVAEGTIFRVFPDKRSLMLAAAEEAVDPAHGQERLDEALRDVVGLRARVVVATGQVLERMHLTMAVMAAVRPHLVALHEEHHRGAGTSPRWGPPPFLVRAQEALDRRLAGLFEPHRDQLSVPPEVAALALRSLVLGASRPELGPVPALTPEQIADLVLHGVMTRGVHSC
ncbi:TetR/AcrR family transcriptional regulator [Nocardioides korecus]